MACREASEEFGGDHGHDHGHDHDHSRPEDSEGDNLYSYIDTTKLRCLNAADPSKVGAPLKPHTERHDRERYLDSNDDDPEFILYIPFTQAVTLKSICISGGEDGKHPRNMKLFVNREDIDFTNAQDLPGAQTLELAEDFQAEVFYPLQTRKFQSISSLTLFVSDNYDGDCTRFYYIGLKGENKEWKHGVVDCIYEAQAQPSDHAVEGTTHRSAV